MMPNLQMTSRRRSDRVRGMVAMSPVQCDRDTFLHNLQKSGLLSPRDFSKLVEQLPRTDRGRPIARALVEAGIITKFQAELLLVGRTHGFFLGQYKILEQLAQGGMGRVYKAMHLTMKRVVALKVLSPQLVETTKARKLFKNEVRNAAQLHHPNIVTAFDANRLDDRHYLVMEFVDGPNLDQLVRQQGPLIPGLACEIIRQAADGLQYAHEMGLVHRDIKPANLLMQKPTRTKSSFTVKILDFGLAQLHEPIPTTETGPVPGKGNTVMGTPDFLSPEQSRNSPGIDIRSDIYSLGCTFYYLLTGRVPFPGGTTLEKLLRHSNEDPVTVALFRSDMPAPVLAVLQRMMAKKPEDRFQAPQEVVQALTPFAGNHVLDLEQATPEPSLPTPSLPNSGDIPEKPAAGGPSTDQVGTVPPDLAPTSFSDDILPLTWEVVNHDQRRFIRKTLWLSLTVITALAALAGILVYLR